MTKNHISLQTFLTYIYVISIGFLLYLQIYLIPKSKQKIAQDTTKDEQTVQPRTRISSESASSNIQVIIENTDTVSEGNSDSNPIEDEKEKAEKDSGDDTIPPLTEVASLPRRSSRCFRRSESGVGSIASSSSPDLERIITELRALDGQLQAPAPTPPLVEAGGTAAPEVTHVYMDKDTITSSRSRHGSSFYLRLGALGEYV